MKNITLLLLLGVSAQCLQAQGKKFTISYPIAFATGSDFKEYIGKTSFRGVSAEFSKSLGPSIDVGIEVAWNVFYQRQNTKAYTDGTATLSGVQYRNTNAVPVLIGGKYYIPLASGGKNKSIVSPYFGAGIGTLYVNRSTDMGLYRVTNETWQFCFRPETGVLLHANAQMSVLAGLKYFAAIENDGLAGQSYLSINFGLVFTAGR